MVNSVQNAANPNFSGVVQQNYPVSLSKQENKPNVVYPKNDRIIPEMTPAMAHALPAVMGIGTGIVSAVVPYERNKTSVLKKADEAITAHKQELEAAYKNSDDYKLQQGLVEYVDDVFKTQKEDLENFHNTNDINNLTKELSEELRLKKAQYNETIGTHFAVKEIAKANKAMHVDEPAKEFAEKIKEQAKEKVKGFKKTAAAIGILAGAAVGGVIYKTINDVHNKKENQNK